MKRLRHPVRAIREPFGTAGLIVACIALIAALASGAYAASGGLNAKQKKEVKKIAKQFAGKPGATGPQGPAGANGKDGANGANGSNGAPGADGKSVVLLNEAPSGCPAAGFTYEVEGSGEENEVCNGKNGQTGFTETLPEEKTETGDWLVGPFYANTFPGESKAVKVPLSFPIPLSEPSGIATHLILSNGNELFGASFEENEEPAACPGTVAAPAAEPGNFCLYAATSNLLAPSNGFAGTLIVNPNTGFVNPASGSAGVSKAGLLLEAFTRETVEVEAYGTWAVTAG